MSYTRLKIKCLLCGLHFTVLTERPYARKASIVYCPECGDTGNKLFWEESVEGFIFEEVPGDTKFGGML